MNIKGKLHFIGDVQNVSDKFKKRDFVIEFSESNPDYKEYVKLECQQDRVTILDKMSVGDEVNVDFNLRGRPWTNKDGETTYFNTLVAWRIVKEETDQSLAYFEAENVTGVEEDSLPF